MPKAATKPILRDGATDRTMRKRVRSFLCGPLDFRGVNTSWFCIVLIALFLCQGCNQAPPSTGTGPQAGMVFTNQPFHQAPELEAREKAGQLPPVVERLPQVPLVIQPAEQVGTYGGSWNMAVTGDTDHTLMNRTTGYEQLVRWDPYWNHVLPNLALRFSASKDNRIYTFTLRKGLRWSDGAPFTTEDIRFWYEEIAFSPFLVPQPPNWLRNNDSFGQLHIIDLETFEFEFKSPAGLFLENIATPAGAVITLYPKHYLKQFLPKYNPDGIAELVRKSGMGSWEALFKKKAGGDFTKASFWDAFELPRMTAWIPSGPYTGNPEIVTVRNPYYWKVDIQGNQLPYLDKVIFHRVPNEEAVVKMALEGKIDMQDRHLESKRAVEDLKAAASKLGLKFYSTLPSSCNTTCIMLTQTGKNPKKNRLFQNKDLRIGLSHAVDRQAIINAVHGGAGIPYQIGPRPESPFYDSQLASQFTEYDTNKANAYLDRAGFATRDEDGFRLAPGNEPFSIEIATEDRIAHQIPTGRMITNNWAAVGIRSTLRIVSHEEFTTEGTKVGSYDAAIMRGFGGIDVVLNPGHVMPYNSISTFAPYWAPTLKPINGDHPEFPTPAPVLEQHELYSRILAAGPNDPSRNSLMSQILRISRDQFYAMGISLPAGGTGIVNKRLRNVPMMIFESYDFPQPAPSNPCQYFLDQSGDSAGKPKGPGA